MTHQEQIAALTRQAPEELHKKLLADKERRELAHIHRMKQHAFIQLYIACATAVLGKPHDALIGTTLEALVGGLAERLWRDLEPRIRFADVPF